MYLSVLLLEGLMFTYLMHATPRSDTGKTEFT